jgi:3-oxoacyl-[acyl-carrier protein] reductase
MNKCKGVTLVTGASGGLGLALVRLILESGVTDVACQFNANSEVLNLLFEEFGLNPNEHVFQADLTNENSVTKLQESILTKLGIVSNIVNLAGGSTNAMSWKLGVDEMQYVLNINLMSTMLVCKVFLPSMRDHLYGRIVNVSSIVAFKGAVGASHYAAAKAAILGYSKSLSLEVANKNVMVNSLALGYMNAGIIDDVPVSIQDNLIEQTPVKRLGNGQDLYNAANYFLDESNSFVTGQVLHVNGGLY